jgi:hypothetical protein
LLQVETRSDDTRRITSEPYFSGEILPNSQIRITIPEDEGSRLIIARFAAQSLCRGTEESSCIVQVQVLDRGTKIRTFLNSGLMVFDSVNAPDGDDDGWETHTVEMSDRLPGSYDIRVTWGIAKSSPTATVEFKLRKWHFTLRQYE